MTGLNLARIQYMELQGIALFAFFIQIHDFIPSLFQAAAAFKKHRFFLFSLGDPCRCVSHLSVCFLFRKGLLSLLAGQVTTWNVFCVVNYRMGTCTITQPISLFSFKLMISSSSSFQAAAVFKKTLFFLVCVVMTSILEN